MLDGLVMGMDFLDRYAKDGGGLWLEDQFVHLTQRVDARCGAYFQRFLGCAPSVGGREFEGADDVAMTEHEDVGRWGDLLRGDDFSRAEEVADEVEGMNVKVEQGIALWIVASEVAEVVADKMLLAQTLLKDLNGGSIAFL